MVSKHIWYHALGDGETEDGGVWECQKCLKSAYTKSRKPRLSGCDESFQSDWGD